MKKKCFISFYGPIILAVMVILFFPYQLRSEAISSDESKYLMLSERIAEEPSLLFTETAWNEKPPLVISLAALFSPIFGTLLAFRIVVLAFGIGGIFLMWSLVEQSILDKREKIFKPWLGFIASSILLFNTWYSVYSNKNMLDVPLIFFFILTAYFTVRYHQTKSTKDIMIASLAVIGGLLTKYVGILLVPVLLTGILISLKKMKKKHWPAMIISLLAICTITFLLTKDLIFKYLGFLTPRIFKHYFMLNINTPIDLLLSYNPIKNDILIVAIFVIFFTYIVYLMRKTNRYGHYTFLLVWISSIFIFRVFFGRPERPRFFLPMLPTIILLLILIVYDSVKLFPLLKKLKWPAAIILISLFAFQTMQTTKLHSYLDAQYSGFKEAGEWLSKNAEQDSIIYTGSTQAILYYSGLKSLKDGGNLYLPKATMHCTIPKDGLDKEHENKTAYLQMDFREDAQTIYKKGFKYDKYIAANNYIIVHVVYATQPAWTNPPRKDQVQFLKDAGLEPYKIIPGKGNPIYVPADKKIYNVLDKEGFRKASSIRDYIEFALKDPKDDWQIYQPIILIFKMDPKA